MFPLPGGGQDQVIFIIAFCLFLLLGFHPAILISSSFLSHRISTKRAEIGPMPKPSPDDEEEKNAKEHPDQGENPPPASQGRSIPETHRRSLLSVFGEIY
jgi:hypothetical protein